MTDLDARLTSLENAVTKLATVVLTEAGHPFYGNQWTGGGGKGKAEVEVRESKASDWTGANAHFAGTLPSGTTASVDAYGASKSFGSYEEPKVNWGGIGSSSAEDTRAYAGMIRDAADRAQTLEPAGDAASEHVPHEGPWDKQPIEETIRPASEFSPEVASIKVQLPDSGRTVDADVYGPGFNSLSPGASVNWPGVGSVSSNDAHTFADLLDHAAKLAGKLKPETG